MTTSDQMPSAASPPWRILLPLGTVLLLGLLWSGYWMVASGMAKSRFAQERATLEGKGVALACTQESWGGYPFHFEFLCTSPRLTVENKAELRSQQLRLTALAYAPWQVVGLLDGPSTVSAQGRTPTEARHGRMIAAVTFGSEGKLPKLSAELPNLAVSGLGQAEKLMLHTRPSEGGGTDIAVSLTKGAIRLPERPPLALAQADVLGRLTPQETLTVERVEIQQGTLRYWGSGEIALDALGRPAGKLDTETNDVDGLLALVAPQLKIQQDQVAGLRAVLKLLGSEAKVPLIAKDGVLYLGPFRIADLPRLR